MSTYAEPSNRKAPPLPGARGEMVIPIKTLEVRGDFDLSRIRRAVAACANDLSFDTLSRTRLVTAASELARNMLTYGGGGIVQIDQLQEPERTGLRAVFTDQGPGIPDPEAAVADGFTSGRGLGLGLGGAKRLVDQFHLDSRPGQGTTVSITSWVRSGRR